jgi:signal peptidase II
MTPSRSPKRAAFWGAVLLIVVTDAISKYLAHTRIAEGDTIPLLRDVIRLTLLYNPGAAFGLQLGDYSRWIFTALASGMLIWLFAMYRDAGPGDSSRALALGLVSGGALGNIVNRLWSDRGVVDWIDIGVGSYRWPAFNVADIGVSVGACILVAVLWRADGVRRAGAPGQQAT